MSQAGTGPSERTAPEPLTCRHLPAALPHSSPPGPAAICSVRPARSLGAKGEARPQRCPRGAELRERAGRAGQPRLPPRVRLGRMFDCSCSLRDMGLRRGEQTSNCKTAISLLAVSAFGFSLHFAYS